MINNWLAWSLWLFDDWFMKSHSISPLRNDCQALLYYLKFGSIIMVYFLLKSGFENISKDTALSDNNNACTVTQAVLKGAKNSVLQFDLFGQAVACIY